MKNYEINLYVLVFKTRAWNSSAKCGKWWGNGVGESTNKERSPPSGADVSYPPSRLQPGLISTINYCGHRIGDEITHS